MRLKTRPFGTPWTLEVELSPKRRAVFRKIIFFEKAINKDSNDSWLHFRGPFCHHLLYSSGIVLNIVYSIIFCRLFRSCSQNGIKKHKSILFRTTSFWRSGHFGSLLVACCWRCGSMTNIFSICWTTLGPHLLLVMLADFWFWSNNFVKRRRVWGLF